MLFSQKMKINVVFLQVKNFFLDVEVYFWQIRYARVFYLVRIHLNMFIMFYQLTLISSYIIKTKLDDYLA